MKRSLFILATLCLIQSVLGQTTVNLSFKSTNEMAAFTVTAYQTNLNATVTADDVKTGFSHWQFAPGDTTTAGTNAVVSTGVAGRWLKRSLVDNELDYSFWSTNGIRFHAGAGYGFASKSMLRNRATTTDAAPQLVDMTGTPYSPATLGEGDVLTPTNVSAHASTIRTRIGFDAGTPGSTATNFITKTNAVGARSTIGASPKLRIVANGAQQQWELAPAAVTDNRTFMTRWFVPNDAANLRLGFVSAGYYTTGGTEGRGSWQTTLPSRTIKAGIQFGTTNVAPCPVLFPNITATYGQDGMLMSEPVGGSAAAGSWLYVRVYRSEGGGATTTNEFLSFTDLNSVPAGTGGYAIGAANGISTGDEAHTQTAIAQTSFAKLVGPTFIYGYTDKPAVAVFGDSISTGVSSSGEIGPWTANLLGSSGVGYGDGGGMWRRAISPQYGLAVIAIPGERLSRMATNTVYRSSVMPYVDVVIDQLGVNDLRAATSSSALITLKTAWWSDLRRRGAAKIYSTTIGPEAMTTDFYFTTNSQTVSTEWPEVVKYNEWVRTNTLSDGYIDLEAVWSPVVGSGVWNTATLYATGSVTSVANTYSITDNTKTFGTNYYGKVLWVQLSGTTNNFYTITTNTANTIYFASSVSGGNTIIPTDTYSVIDSYCVDKTSGVHPTGYAYAQAAVVISNALPAMVSGLK